MADLTGGTTSYPTSIDTRTSLSDGANGNEILAAHINGALAAIIAIETELGVGLKGTAATLVARLSRMLASNGAVASGTSFPVDPTPVDGQLFWRSDLQQMYAYNGTTSQWQSIAGVTDHGSLGGLVDDDHAQYLKTDGMRDLTGQQKIVAGTASVPGLAIVGDANTGVFQETADTVALTAGGTRVLQAETAASGVNYVKATPGATGTGPTLTSAGSDTNADLLLTAKGTGRVKAAGHGVNGRQVFTGSGTFTGPAGVTEIVVTAWGAGAGGGGGGGGDGNSAANAGSGGGGGGAGAIVKRVVTITPGEACTVTIGAGGTAGTAGTAGPGGGGSGGTGGTGGIGGTTTFVCASTTISAPGGSGGTGGTSDGTTFGLGGAAASVVGTGANSTATSSGTGTTGGVGGAHALAHAGGAAGAGGNPALNAGPGLAGSTPTDKGCGGGGGGGGGRTTAAGSGGTGGAGGVGAAGLVIVEW